MTAKWGFPVIEVHGAQIGRPIRIIETPDPVPVQDPEPQKPEPVKEPVPVP